MEGSGSGLSGKVEWGLSEGDIGPMLGEAEDGFPVVKDFWVHTVYPGGVFLPGFEVIDKPDEV